MKSKTQHHVVPVFMLFFLLFPLTLRMMIEKGIMMDENKEPTIDYQAQ